MADLSGLTGNQRDVAVAVNALFESYGIKSLAGKIIQFVQEGMSADTVAIELQNTPEYKQRFSANDVRIRNGLAALSPAEYIAVERSYRQIMSNAGLPVGFYDQQSDFTKFLELDVSPTELQNRVNAAAEAVQKAPPETLSYAQQWYGIGDMVAYALDPTKATALVEKRLSAATSAALAARNGTTVSQGVAEQIGAQGFSYGQLQQGFGQVGQDSGTLKKLAEIYGSSATSDDLVKEVFLSDAESTKKVKGLASQERASFAGTGGAGRGALSSDGGQL